MNEYRRKVTSQWGQDGVLAEVFRRIGPGSQWCVEIGAYDGYNLSNTWSLVNEQGWNAVLLEADPGRAAACRERYAGVERVTVVEGRVSDLQAALAATPLPKAFDLLCIDVDGDDYHLWQSLTEYRPRVVLIETNPTFGWDVEYIPKRGGHMGSSLLALHHLAESRDYRLAAYIEIDALFVEVADWEKLGVAPRSLAEHMALSDRYIPRLVSDLDGRHYLLRSGPWGARDDDDTLHSEFLRSRRELDESAEKLGGAPRLWEKDAWPCRKP